MEQGSDQTLEDGRHQKELEQRLEKGLEQTEPKWEKANLISPPPALSLHTQLRANVELYHCYHHDHHLQRKKQQQYC